MFTIEPFCPFLTNQESNTSFKASKNTPPLCFEIPSLKPDLAAVLCESHRFVIVFHLFGVVFPILVEAGWQEGAGFLGPGHGWAQRVPNETSKSATFYYWLKMFQLFITRTPQNSSTQNPSQTEPAKHHEASSLEAV